MEFGMLLPHFGQHCRPDRLVDYSRRLEALGFDSVWVRDHLIWKPHGMEGTDQTFVEPFVTLAAVAGATKRIGLGTAVLIPIRWPLKVAQEYASLSYISGGRVEAGFGLGSNPAEFAAAGFTVAEREQIFAETVAICRRVWTEDNVSWKGERFEFENVTISPKPVKPINIWYGGTTRASVRRAVEHCDGWLPGRIPMATLDDRLAYLRKLTAQGARRIKVGVIPLVVVDSDREKARAKLDVQALAGSSEGSRHWVKPPSGEFRTIEDLEGLVVVGNPEECALGIRKFAERGVDLFIFDLRLQFEEYEGKAELVAREVLPHVR